METMTAPSTMTMAPNVAISCRQTSSQHQRTRRINRRANVSWTVFARVRGQRCRFHTVDVSVRGAKLRPRLDVLPGTSLTLQFVKSNGRRVRVAAMVWRVDPDGLGVFFLGSDSEGLMG
jgi:PilZ domain